MAGPLIRLRRDRATTENATLKIPNAISSSAPR